MKSSVRQHVRCSRPRPSLLRRIVAILLLAFAIAASRPAFANDIANAESLFQQAKALMAKEKFREACPLLEESYRLDPAAGTYLNMALCHEEIGKIATAWGEFAKVESDARRANPPREDRATLARDHAKKLADRLSRIKIVIPEAARAPGLEVKVDGDVKREPLLSMGVTVDLGTHTITVSAPEKKPWTTTVKIDDERETKTVTVVPLLQGPKASPSTASSSGQVVDLSQAEQLANNRARRTTGYVLGGLGVAVLGLGGTFGVLAILNNNDAKGCSPCYKGPNTTSSGDKAAADASGQATDRALTFANIANVTVPLGLLSLGVGTYLILTSGASAPAPKPAASATASGFRVLPSFGPQSSGLVFLGGF